MPWLTTTFTLNRMSGSCNLSAYAAFICEGVDQETANFYNKKRSSSI